jgi:peroxiredoxin Q/BCP
MMRKLLGIFGGLLMGIGAAHAAPLKVGDTAPDFSAPSSGGTTVHLKEAVGKTPIVVYFYPKDDTPGCTKEACGLRDNFAAFRALNATIYGISYDSVDSHKEFAKKHQLPFLLLSDTDKRIAKSYGADGLLLPKRMTFVIGLDGKIAWINPSVSPQTHSAELKDVLKRLSTQPQSVKS